MKRARRGRSYPGFTAQSLQQLAFVRSGPKAGEVILPAKMISGTGTVPMLNGLIKSAPMWAPPAMREAADRLRLLIFRFIPDGLAANQFVMTAFADEVASACVLESHCASHLIQVVWESGSRDQLISNLVSCT